MKSIIAIAVIVLGVEPSWAFSLWPTTGNGKIEVSSYKVDDFNRLTVEGAYQVSIESGNDDVVVIEGEQNLIDRTSVQVKGGELVISETTWLKPQKPLTVRIKKSGLTALVAKGSSSIYWGSISAKSLELTVVGSGALRGFLGSVQKLKVVSTGSGSVVLNGQVDYLSASATGSSSCSFNLDKLKEARVEASGSVQCYLKNAQSAVVELDGASVLTFGGSSASVRSQTTGSSTVKFQND